MINRPDAFSKVVVRKSAARSGSARSDRRASRSRSFASGGRGSARSDASRGDAAGTREGGLQALERLNRAGNLAARNRGSANRSGGSASSRSRITNRSGRSASSRSRIANRSGGGASGGSARRERNARLQRAEASLEVRSAATDFVDSRASGVLNESERVNARNADRRAGRSRSASRSRGAGRCGRSARRDAVLTESADGDHDSGNKRKDTTSHL